ncbi:DUF3320 domain-containing protein [Pikeienuella sp. HZG-20]|uniref:DUF3320 domain-containing protein n=1 Tax=Paludibacillus litoralis TaxID=3133267 RepID=UPI0030EECB0C
MRPKSWIVDRLGPHDEADLSDLAMDLDLEGLAGLDETEIGELTLTVESDGDLLLEERRRLEFLARDQWGGLADMDRLLAAYVSPNEAAIAAILKDASRLLAKAGRDDALEGYQSGDPQRAYMIAGAVWSAVTALGLTYAQPPASFEREGQKVRFPTRIRNEGLATCLDTSLLLAAAWEQAGLNPVVLFAKGHAWAGVWITASDFGRVTEPDVVAVRKASQTREFLPAETTFLCKRPTIGFAEAIDAGRVRLSEDHEDDFQAAVDIRRARAAKIRPLASHIPSEEAAPDQTEAVAAALPDPIDLGLSPSETVDASPETPQGRIERWQSKLLDLSLRNRLLNFRETKQSVACMVPDAGTLEDALANGKSFKTFPLKDEDPIGDRQVSDLERRRILAETVRDAYARGQVTVPLTGKDMEARLLSLHRKAKSDLQEGGTNTLFLAAGFLRWKREGDRRIYRAPLILIPIQLTRRSARSPFQIEHHENDVRFNATLLEFLKRDFDIRIPQLEAELPRDDSGIDVPMVLETVRARVHHVAGFEVTEDLAISTFSFAKYLMWKDLVDRTDDLRKNRLVAHLVDKPTETFDSGRDAPLPPEKMDSAVAPKDLLTPLPADSSQLAAVVAAMEGRDFVLIGPPGTGKSQTIANIVAQCLAHGKTVLFVAEKAAALDVVQRRLQAQGLGDAVLELHSNKTDRKRVLAQLGRGWDRASGAEAATWIDINERLKLTRDQLNAYVAAVHAKGRRGFSVFTAIGWATRGPEGVTLSFADKGEDAHDAESFAHMERLAEDLGRAWTVASDGPPIALVGETDWSYAWEGGFLEAAKSLRTRIDSLLTVASGLGRRLALKPDTSLSDERARLLTLFAARGAAGADNLTAAPDLAAGALRDAVAAFEADLSGLAEAARGTSARYREDDIPRMPLDEMDARLRESATRIWPFSRLERRKLQKLLQTYATSGVAAPEGDLASLRDMRKRLDALARNPLAELAGEDRAPHGLRRLVDQAIELRAGLAQAQAFAEDHVAFGAVAAELVAGPADPLRAELQRWLEAHAAFAASRSAFIDAGGLIPEDASLSRIMRWLDTILAERRRLANWMRWLETRTKADAAGLAPLADALKAGEPITDAVAAFRSAYARWWLPLALDASDVLRRFLHWEHEDLIRTFRALDDEAARQVPAEIMRRIHHGLPAKDGVPRNSELGILRHQLGLQRPSMPIRGLLEHMPETLLKLAPCVLMSPLSVAQYLPPGQATFDVVIFDEASQITTWDAIGAIARARQSIIVGDPKQLPPTNFFGRSDDGGDEGDALDFLNRDMPSILDEVATAGIPTRRLDWHYRSRDEALIAFSNHHYYGGGLVTFPSPSTGSGALRFHKVDGVYARGSGRRNVEEARAIAGMVRRRLSAWLDLPEADRHTLGVITFNQQQQALIQDLLDDIRRSAPELEWFFADEREEPVIVKNLENIQGDERDVMLFSITFGPDPAGKLTMNFGALNSDGGEKRLNVAITRARREMHVFASITHDQIDLARTHAQGVKDLKTFLDYAERGAAALPARDEGSLGPAESPFEEAVARAFGAKGWEVRTQIGVSGYRVDLGIVNPDRGGSYLAGIECDGAAYHSSATARDRDKVRQAVLEGLGWTILRIWSTEWFRDPKSATLRLHTELERLLAADRARRAEEAARAAERKKTAKREEAAEPESLRALAAPITADAQDAPPAPTAPSNEPPPLQIASSERAGEGASEPSTDKPLFAKAPEGAPHSGEMVLNPARFYETAYLPILRDLATDIASQQGPLPLQRLAREVAHRHGWQRTGQRILSQVERALDVVERREEFHQVFIWPKQGYRNRVAFRGLGTRSILDISRTEIASALDALGPNSVRDEAEMQRARDVLGISRLSQSARAYILQCDQWRLLNSPGE